MPDLVTTPLTPAVAALRTIDDRHDERMTRIHDHYRRRLDVLFAADPDQLIADAGPDTQTWSVDDMVGVDPGWTGDLTTDEYISRQRDDGWTPTPPDRALLLDGLDRLNPGGFVKAATSPILVGDPDAVAAFMHADSSDDLPGVVLHDPQESPHPTDGTYGGWQPRLPRPLRWLVRFVEQVRRDTRGQS